MRHEQVKLRDTFDIVDAARIWPRADVGPQAPMAELEAALDVRPAPAVPDVPVAVGALIVAVYAALIGVFLLTMAKGGEATFMIVVSALYLAIFFAVPIIFLKVERDRSRRPTLARFMAEGIDTHTGRMSGASALVQMFVVPVLLTAGIAAMGVAALLII